MSDNEEQNMPEQESPQDTSNGDNHVPTSPDGTEHIKGSDGGEE